MTKLFVEGNLCALQTWKKKRRIIATPILHPLTSTKNGKVEELVKTNFHNYEVFQLPTNRIRSHQKLSLKNFTAMEQEKILFDDFITLCRGANTPTMQCETNEESQLEFQVSQGCLESIFQSLTKCFVMPKNLFLLEMCISRLRVDRTRGPVVFTFCSVVLKYIQKQFYQSLLDLENIACPNVLTLQRKCNDLNDVLKPLEDFSRTIEECDLVGGELINYLMEEIKDDRRSQIRKILKDVISLSLKRYCEIIFEWISQCTLTFDLAHEFFIWDLSKTNSIKRKEFTSQNWDGTEFDQRFVAVPELCPGVFKVIFDEIIKCGRYLYTMQTQQADLNLLSSQIKLDANLFRDKTMDELREIIRNIYKDCSISIMHHLSNKFDVFNFALRLPNYFLGMNSIWIEELAVNYEEGGFWRQNLNELNKNTLSLLIDKSIDNDWLKDDFFRKYFELQPFKFGTEENDSELELHINWDSTLNLVFPESVMESYRKLFRLAFKLYKARYLLHKKRFFDSTFHPCRMELSVLFLMIRFVHVYHTYVFVTMVQEIYPIFLEKFRMVENLDGLVKVQCDFLYKLLDISKIDMEKSIFTETMLQLISLFCSYSRNIITFEELGLRASSQIGKLKKILLKSNDYSIIRNLLFGCNFTCIGADAEQEPLWLSLRHIEPMTQ